jgi:hypothetical protein
MCRICFTAHITDYTPTATATLTNFMNRNSKTVARRHSAANNGCAISAHDDAVIRPARSGEIERTCAHVRLQLGRTAQVRETERFRVDCPASNENGQATSSPAVSVESGVNVDHQALPQ